MKYIFILILLFVASFSACTKVHNMNLPEPTYPYEDEFLIESQILESGDKIFWEEDLLGQIDFNRLTSKYFKTNEAEIPHSINESKNGLCEIVKNAFDIGTQDELLIAIVDDKLFIFATWSTCFEYDIRFPPIVGAYSDTPSKDLWILVGISQNPSFRNVCSLAGYVTEEKALKILAGTLNGKIIEASIPKPQDLLQARRFIVSKIKFKIIHRLENSPISRITYSIGNIFVLQRNGVISIINNQKVADTIKTKLWAAYDLLIYKQKFGFNSDLIIVTGRHPKYPLAVYIKTSKGWLKSLAIEINELITAIAMHPTKTVFVLGTVTGKVIAKYLPLEDINPRDVTHVNLKLQKGSNIQKIIWKPENTQAQDAIVKSIFFQNSGKHMFVVSKTIAANIIADWDVNDLAQIKNKPFKLSDDYQLFSGVMSLDTRPLLLDNKGILKTFKARTKNASRIPN